MSRKVMEFILENLVGGQHYTIFEDSDNFLERVESLSPPPTVIFLDIHVSPHDGFAMLELLREHPDFYDAKIIAVTASVMNEEIKQLKQAGFDSCIAKPINADLFPALLDRILSGEQVWSVR